MLSRFRADPIVSVTDYGHTPRAAIFRALRRAEGHVLGVDRDMSWTYEHPWKPTDKQ
jgi:hypothetical protein